MFFNIVVFVSSVFVSTSILITEDHVLKGPMYLLLFSSLYSPCCVVFICFSSLICRLNLQVFASALLPPTTYNWPAPCTPIGAFGVQSSVPHCGQGAVLICGSFFFQKLNINLFIIVITVYRISMQSISFWLTLVSR